MPHVSVFPTGKRQLTHGKRLSLFTKPRKNVNHFRSEMDTGIVLLLEQIESCGISSLQKEHIFADGDGKE